jgi:phosphoribosylamine--glycine ligase
VVVGPEALLAEGVADTLRAAGLAVVGPSKEAARLETEKTFAKAFLARHRIPTARSIVLESAADDASLDAFPDASVVKFDGLAEGKGVVVCDDAKARDCSSKSDSWAPSSR